MKGLYLAKELFDRDLESLNNTNLSKAEKKPKVSEESSDIYSTAMEDYKGVDPLTHYKIAKYHEKNDYPAGAEAHKQMAREKTKGYSAEEHEELSNQLFLNEMGSFSGYHKDAAIEASPTEEELDGSQEEDSKKNQDKSENGNSKKEPKKEENPKKESQSKKEEQNKEQPKEDSESESVKQARALDYKAKAAKLKQTIDEHLSSGDLSPEEEAKLQHISETMDSHSNLEGAPSEDQVKELQELEKISGEHSKPPENKGGDQKQPEEQKKPPKGTFQDDPSSKPQSSEEEEGGGGKEGDGTDWEYWGRPGTPPPDKGWEKSPTGKWRRPRGDGGSGGSSGGGSGKVSIPSKGPSLKGAFQQGRAAGAALASAASSGSGAGGIAETSVNYASQGAMSAGHHLLKKPAQKKAQQQQTKPTQGQSSLGKSMSLYLDLYKADSPTTVMPRTESQAKVEYESSYAKVTPGVTGGGPSLKEDDPKEGRQWKHSEEDSVEAEVDEMLEDREPDNDEEETSKSLSILKTLNTVVTQDVQKHLPTETEMKFLIEELGHSPEEVKKGQVFITGKNRHRFNEWAHNNLIKSIQSLSGRLV